MERGVELDLLQNFLYLLYSERAVGPKWPESETMCEAERVNSTLAISRLRTTAAFRLHTIASCRWYGFPLTL